MSVALLERADVASVPEPEHNSPDRECKGAYGQDPIQGVNDIEEDNSKNREHSPAEHQDKRCDSRTPKLVTLLNQRRRRLSIGLTHAQSLAPCFVLRAMPYRGRMSNGFAFHEPQPVIDEGDNGLPIVVVFPAGVAYTVAGVESGWVNVLLPSPNGSEFESTFPESVGNLLRAAKPEPGTPISYREAAERYPDLISAADLDEYEAAAKTIAEWS